MTVYEALEQVAGGLATLAALDLDALCDASLDDTLVALQQLSHQLAGQVCRFAHG